MPPQSQGWGWVTDVHGMRRCETCVVNKVVANSYKPNKNATPSASFFPSFFCRSARRLFLIRHRNIDAP